MQWLIFLFCFLIGVSAAIISLVVHFIAMRNDSGYPGLEDVT